MERAIITAELSGGVERPRGRRFAGWGVLALALFLLEQTVLAGTPHPVEPGVAPVMVFGSSTGTDLAPALDTRVELKFTGPVGRARIRQRFFNGSGDWVEGTYVFPLPGQAAVDSLRLRVGDRVIVGEVQEKEQAKANYRRARDEGRRASLVEQERPNVFTTSVANVAPGETVEVEIGFWVHADYDAGAFRIRLPLTLTPRYIPGYPLGPSTGDGWARDTDQVNDASRITPPVSLRASADTHRASIDVHLDAGLPLIQVSSATHELQVENRGVSYRVVLREGPVPMDRDFEMQWRPAASDDSEAALWIDESTDGVFGLLMLAPPAPTASAPPQVDRELILVVDTSGSMGGVSIRQARRALNFALDQLRSGDRFNVIRFSSVTRRLFPASVPASGANLERARRYVNALDAEGGTEMAPALRAALEQPGGEALKQIVFVTDGSVGNESRLLDLIDRNIKDARLFTVALGSAPNGWFMREAARAGRGTFTAIPTLNEVAHRMESLFDKLTRPRVTDIAIDWGTGSEVWPDTPPDLYSDQPLLLTARLEEVPDLVTVSGRSGERYWLRQLVPGPRAAAGVAPLWARRKVDGLLDREKRDGESMRPKVTELALRYGLLTPFTALVAVDRTPARSASSPLERGQVPSLLPAGSDARTLIGFPATATSARLRILLGGFCLCASLGLFWGALWGVPTRVQRTGSGR